jgi:hypothetical protein
LHYGRPFLPAVSTRTARIACRSDCRAFPCTKYSFCV